MRAVTRQRREFGPPEIRSLDQWVVTKLTPKPGRPNNKPPYVQNGHGELRLAEGSVDSRAHMPYSLAASLVRDGASGMQWPGFVTLPTSHITGVDIDNCRSPRSGALGFSRTKAGTPGFWTPALVAYLPTYWSVSPSGRGLRAWVSGDVPDGPDREGGHGKWTRIGLEMYSQGQYLTETGLWLRATPSHARPLQDRLALLASAADALNRAMEKPTRLRDLWIAPGDSETDLSLASRLARFTHDPEVLELLLRLSGAYREKWDENRGGASWLVREVVEPALASPARTEPADLAEAVESELRRRRARAEADRILGAEAAPPFPALLRADQWFQTDLPDPTFLVKDLWIEGTVCLFSAEYKAGKTTTVLNLARSLLDGAPFLGRFATPRLARPILLVNAEMAERQFRLWLREMGIQNAANLHILNTQGTPIDLRLPATQDRLVSALQSSGCGTLILDTFSALYWGEENSNTEEAAFCRALDQIRRRANAPNLALVNHMGRKIHEAGREHGRGGSYMDGWADARWILVQEKGGSRWFRANGRDISVGDELGIELEYDEVTRLLGISTSGRSRSEARRESQDEQMAHIVQSVVMFVRQHPGSNVTAVRTGLGGNLSRVSKAIDIAVSQGKIEDRIEHPKGAPTRARALFTVERSGPSAVRPVRTSPRAVRTDENPARPGQQSPVKGTTAGRTGHRTTSEERRRPKRYV